MLWSANGLYVFRFVALGVVAPAAGLPQDVGVACSSALAVVCVAFYAAVGVDGADGLARCVVLDGGCQASGVGDLGTGGVVEGKAAGELLSQARCGLGVPVSRWKHAFR